MEEFRTVTPAALFGRVAFVQSAAALRQCPPPGRPEVAFAGRSNAGKSSVINALTGQKALARVSKTPGRTQLLNFFDMADAAYLVDLPGYGFAKAPARERRAWQAMVEGYLTRREPLAGLVVIMDIRRPLTDIDSEMLSWCAARPMPAVILLNKADKLSKGAAAAERLQTQRAVGEAAQVIAVSARTGTGMDAARDAVCELLFPQQVA